MSKELNDILDRLDKNEKARDKLDNEYFAKSERLTDEHEALIEELRGL